MAPVTSLHHSTNDSISSTSSLSHTSKDSVLKKDKRELLFGIPVHSSQESSFEGFGNSPFDKLQRIFYPQPPTVFANPTPESSESNPQMAPPKHSPGKNIFTKFYDTILEENSCNAVDIQMSNDPNIIASVRRSSSSSSISNYTDANPSSELSFNGKIKSLTKRGEVEEPLEVTMEPPRLSAVLETSLNTSQTQFSESFILKKYSNEKSPDLFGDDDDDDDEQDEMDEEEEPQTQPLNTITEDPTVVVEALNESQQTSACLNEALENNSLNCPADLSFPNDDQTLDCSLTQMSAGGGGNSSDSYTLFRDNCRREREMLRRIRKCLAGVLPPPSVTIPQLDMFTAVLSRKDEILNYFQKSPMKKPDEQKETTANRVPSLFRPTHTLEETKSMPWRDVLGVRQHGLRYNCLK